MVANPQAQRMSLDEYWQLEETSDMRHEYIDGYVYDQAGGTAAHTRIAINTTVALDQELQSGPCRVFNSDMRVKLNDNRYVYPDVAVSCDVADAQDDVQSLQSPRLVIEILSNSTEANDRGKKLACYQERASIQEYAIIATTRQAVEVHRRKTNGEWACQHYTAGQTVDFKSIDVQVALSALYKWTKVPAE